MGVGHLSQGDWRPRWVRRGSPKFPSGDYNIRRFFSGS